MTPPSTGEITHEAAILLIVAQFTALNPAAAMPAPITPPTTEWVVETGAPTQVARFTQRADETNAAIIAQTKISAEATAAGSMMPFEMVLTTSPPASKRPGAFEHRGDNQRRRHGHGIRPDRRADIVGDVIGANVQRHVAAQHGGGDDED